MNDVIVCVIAIITRSTGTLHTSAKARLTSVVIWMLICDPDRHQILIIYSSVQCQPSSENFMQIHLEVFAQSC